MGAMAPPSRLSSLPSWRLTQLARHTQRLVSAGFADAGARGYHYRLLAALREFGPTSQAELGRWCAIDRSDVVAAINELAVAGYVSRSPDPVDRRRNIVEITPAGERQAARLDEAVDGVQDELLAPLSAAERRQLTALLGRLLDHHAPTH